MQRQPCQVSDGRQMAAVYRPLEVASCDDKYAAAALKVRDYADDRWWEVEGGGLLETFRGWGKRRSHRREGCVWLKLDV